MRKRNFVTVAIVAGMIAASMFALSGCGQTVMPESIKVESTEKKVITVTSNEEVKVVPDIAQIVFSVYSQAETAEDCQTKNNVDLDKVLLLLADFGIEEKSIQTSGYGLNPVYDWNSGKTLTGYEMITDVTLSDLPIDQVGTLLSECVDAGVNNIQSVTYLSSKYDESYQEALKKAVESAKVKAEAIAAAGNCTLGTILHVEEYNSNQEARYTGYRNMAVTETAGAGAAAMDVAPGQVRVGANISVEFEIQ